MIDMDKIKIRTIWKNHLVASLNISVVITHSQHVCVYIGRIHQTGDWLDKNKESDDHQEQAIDESGEDFNTAIPATNKGAVLEHPAWSYSANNFKMLLLLFTHRRRSWLLSSGSWVQQTSPGLEPSNRTACGSRQRSVPSCWSKRRRTAPQRWKPVSCKPCIS